MKKILFAGLLLAGFATANAQKGSILVYGDLGFTSGKDAAKTKTSSFDFNPGVGYQFNDSWTAGLALGIGSSKTTPDGGSSVKSSNFNVGPFVRYTQPLASVFSIFGQLNADYLSGKTGTAKYTGVGVNLKPAVAINLKNSFALNFDFGGLGFESSKYKGASNSSTEFGLTFGKVLNIGISKNFGGGSKKK